MAHAGEIPTDLTLAIGGALSPDDFLSAVRNFFGYVHEITQALQGDASAVEWTVRVKEGSSLIGLEPGASSPPSRLSAIYSKVRSGVNALAAGDIEGSGLGDKAINHLKSLTEIGEKSATPPRLELWVQRQPIVLSVAVSKAIKTAQEGDTFDYGSIEGRLEAIRDKNGSLKVSIRDHLYPRMIECTVPESMVERVLSSFRRRVELTGRIHFRHDGVPIKIEVGDIDLIPEDDDLPSSQDVRGILTSV